MDTGVNILFWNIHKNEETFPLIVDLAAEYMVDIFVFAEFPAEKEYLLDNMLPGYLFHDTGSDHSRIKYVVNGRVSMKNVGISSSNRGSFQYVAIDGNKDINFNLVGCHLHDAINHDEISRNNFAMIFNDFIKRYENKRLGEKSISDRTIVVGDFNMNPFDRGMRSITAFNATMDERTALKMTRKLSDEIYPYFYNPLWHFLGHHEHIIQGTLYGSGSDDTADYWHIFDQLLIRPCLISNFEKKSLRIIDRVKQISLLTPKHVINSKISDHLPIFFSLNFKNN